MPAWGNPDLYASVGAGNSADPSSALYSGTQTIGSDTLTIPASDPAVRLYCPRSGRPGDTCIIRVGVVSAGSTTSGFTVLVSDGRAAALSPGLILTGTTSAGSLNTYVYTPAVPTAGSSSSSATSGTVGEIAFALTSLAGSPTIYVSSSRSGASVPTPSIPSSYCASWSPLDLTNTQGGAVSAVPGNGGSSIIGRVSFNGGHPCYCGANNATNPTACVYYVSVTANDFGSYALATTDTDTPSATSGASSSSLLYDGVSINSALVQGGTQYYDFTFVPAAVTQPDTLVTITLTQFYGAPTTVYAIVARSGGVPNIPGRGNADYTAVPVDGTATIAIARNDALIAANCGGPSSSNVCRLRMAVVSGAVPRNSSAPRALEGGSSGDQQAASSLRRLQATPAPLLFAGFALVARTDVGAIIDDGAPLLAVAPQGRFSYFRFTHVSPGSTFVIAAMGISGPVDVYVGLNSQPSTVPPTKANGGFVYRAVSSVAAGGTSTLVLTPDDAPQLECTYPCTYTIGVTPASGSDGAVTFSLLLRVRGSTPFALLDGQPQLDAALAFDLNYYTFALPVLPPSGLATGAGAASVTFSLSPIGLTANINAAGNNVTTSTAGLSTGSVVAQIFVRVGDGPIDIATPSTYHYSSLAVNEAGGEVAVTVNGNDAVVASLCAANGGAAGPTAARSVCSLTVLVHTTTSAVYTVTAATGNRLLVDGVPTTGRVGTGSTVYYAYFASAGASHVQLSLTPLAGTPVVYISSTTPNPTALNAEYTVGGFAADTITLDTANRACATRSARGSCIFYITVTTLQGTGAAGGLAAFRLQGTSSRLTRLELGTPVSGLASSASLSYYGLYVPDTPQIRAQGIEVNAEAVSGGFLSLLAGNEVTQDGTSTPMLPTATCSAAGCDPATFRRVGWSATGVQYRTRLFLKPTDNGWRVGTMYVIAVAASADAEFVLTASVAGSASILVTGVPVEDVMSRTNDTLYYRALLSDGVSTVTVQGMPYYGDIAVAVAVDGTTTRPSATSPSRTTIVARLSEAYRVDISASQLAACVRDPVTRFCSVYIAVTATGAPTAFSLVATVDGGSPAPIRLSEGRPTRSAVLQGNYAYFFAPVPNNTLATGGTIYVSLVELAGEADLFVNTNGQLPSRTAYGATVDVALGSKFVAIGPGSPLYSRTMSTVTIAVFGANTARFFVTFTTSISVQGINDGVAAEGRAALASYAFYSLTVGPNAGDITVAVAALAGNPTLVASRWDNPRVNTAFRPSRSPGGASFTAGPNGMLSIPAGATNGCPAMASGADPADYECTIIIGVWCDNSYANPVPCEFLLTPSTTGGSLTRLAEGVPVRTVLGQGTYRYFLYESPRVARNISFVANVDSGAVQLVVSTAYMPGVSPISALPRLDVESSYSYMTYTDFPVIQFTQDADAANAAATSGLSNTTTSTRLYVLGVYAAEGPASVEITAGASMTPLLLSPGETISGNTLTAGGQLMFAVETRDTSRDLVVAINAIYGDVVVSVASPRSGGPLGTLFSCSYYTRPARGVNCTGAVWQATTDFDGNALIRVPFRRPCTATSTIPGQCDPVADFTAGTYLVSVVAVQDTQFSISAVAATGHLRLLDGKPLTIVQDAAQDTQLLMYSVLAEASNPDLRITLSVNGLSTSLTMYVNYCADDGECSDLVEHPGPAAGSSRANYTATSGSRTDLVLTSSSPAYCRGDTGVAPGGHRVCTYYLSVFPDTAHCAANRISPCVAEVTITPTLMSATATVVLDYPSLGNTLTVLTAEAAPAKYSRYYLYVRDNDMPTNDVLLRLDACDTLAGYIVAYACENPAFYSTTPALGNGTNGRRVPVGVNGVPFCSNPRAPTTSDYQFTMSTTPDTAGGAGRSRAFITGTPARLVHMSVTVPNPLPGYAAAKARFGESQYEMSVTTGRAVFLKQPTLDGVGALRVNIKASENTNAYLSWTAPLVLNDSSAARFDYGTYAVNVTYKIYVAPLSFAASAANGTNTTMGFVGVVSTTACGLDRWQRLSGRFGAVYTTRDTKFVLRGLGVAQPYEINVVAICDDDCLRTNAAYYGYAVQEAGLSAQRVPYAVVVAKTLPPIEEALDLSEPGPEGLTGALAPIGIIATILLIAVVGYIIYRTGATAKAAEAAKLAATDSPTAAAGGAVFAGGAGTPANQRAPLVTRANADQYFRPKSPALRRNQNAGNAAQQNIAEAERLAASLQARITATQVPALPLAAVQPFGAEDAAVSGSASSPAVTAPARLTAATAPMSQAPASTASLTPSAGSGPSWTGVATNSQPVPATAPQPSAATAPSVDASQMTTGRRGRAPRGGAPMPAEEAAALAASQRGQQPPQPAPSVHPDEFSF